MLMSCRSRRCRYSPLSGAGVFPYLRAMTENECPICRRPLGIRSEKHHLVPRSEGGRETVAVHPICHRKIHIVFSEKELAIAYDTPEALRSHPEMARFIKWVSKRPADFHRRTRRKRNA
ncbi:MAG: HNH endonuclease [Alphaproteobacteria bacterium]